jgi:hypothetical protein
VTLVHSFPKWTGIVPGGHKLSPNLLDSDWIILKNDGKVRIISNMGSSAYYADEQYPVLPDRTLVQADHNSTLQAADFATSDSNISRKMIPFKQAANPQQSEPKAIIVSAKYLSIKDHNTANQEVYFIE